MTSKITMEISFSDGKPYIRIINDTHSDDVRDKLIRYFRELFGHTSSWCKFVVKGQEGNNHLSFIEPIAPEQLEEEAKIMTEQARLLKRNETKESLSH